MTENNMIEQNPRNQNLGLEIENSLKNLIERSKKFKGPEKRIPIYDLTLDSNFLDGGIKFSSYKNMRFTDRKFQRDIRDISIRISKLMMENHDPEEFHRILNMDEFKILFLFFSLDQEATDRLSAAMLEFFEVFRKKSIQSPKDLETRESLVRAIQHLRKHRKFNLEEMTFYDVFNGEKVDLKGVIRLPPKRMYMKVYKYKRNMKTLMGLFLANSDRWEVIGGNEGVGFGDEPIHEGIKMDLNIIADRGIILGEMVDSSTARVIYDENEGYTAGIMSDYELKLYLP